MKVELTNRQSERINIQRTDSKVIGQLADQHPTDPNGFINSLDSFFRNMCMEMVNNKKGGRV